MHDCGALISIYEYFLACNSSSKAVETWVLSVSCIFKTSNTLTLVVLQSWPLIKVSGILLSPFLFIIVQLYMRIVFFLPEKFNLDQSRLNLCKGGLNLSTCSSWNFGVETIHAGSSRWYFVQLVCENVFMLYRVPKHNILRISLAVDVAISVAGLL